jgi:glucose-6-phosphate 1-dehydrogenase
VPFFLRSGKRLPRKTTEIVVTFKPTPHCLFSDRVRGRNCLPPNQIVMNVQPDEGIHLRFDGKVPGLDAGQGMRIKSVVMDFDYVKQFQASPPEAYTTLLLDAIRGDQTLFKGRHEIEHAWRVVQPVLDHWAEHPATDLPNYAAGTWGPSAADVLLGSRRQWRNEQGAAASTSVR